MERSSSVSGLLRPKDATRGPARARRRRRRARWRREPVVYSAASAGRALPRGPAARRRPWSSFLGRRGRRGGGRRLRRRENSYRAMAPATPALSDSTAPAQAGASGMVTSCGHVRAAPAARARALGADARARPGAAARAAAAARPRAPPARTTRGAAGSRATRSPSATSGYSGRPNTAPMLARTVLGAVQVGGARGRGEGGGAEGHRRAQQRAHVARVGDAVGVDDEQRPAPARRREQRARARRCAPAAGRRP